MRGGSDHKDVASAPFRSIVPILFNYNSLFFGLNKSFCELHRMKEFSEARKLDIYMKFAIPLTDKEIRKPKFLKHSYS